MKKIVSLYGKAFLLLVVIFSFLIRIFLVFNSLEVADVAIMKGIAEKVISGINPYINPDFYVYPPLSLAMLAPSLVVSQNLDFPFHYVVKIWPNLADFAITGLLYIILRKKKTSKITSALWSLFYLINPMTMIISSAHGQVDSIPLFFVLLSIFFFEFRKTPRDKLVGMLFLGISFAIKPISVFLLPLFLFYEKSTVRRKFTLLLVSFIPLIVSFLPFIYKAPLQVVLSTVDYSGAYDFGYAAVLRAIAYQDNANFWLGDPEIFINISRVIFFIALAFLYLIYIRSKKDLWKASLAIYLLYYVIYFGISAQHLIWVIPLAIGSLKKEVFGFSLVGIISYLGFYTFFGPDILFGKLINFAPYKSAYMSLYFFGNLMLWIYVVVWLYRTLASYIAEKRRHIV